MKTTTHPAYFLTVREGDTETIYMHRKLSAAVAHKYSHRLKNGEWGRISNVLPPVFLSHISKN